MVDIVTGVFVDPENNKIEKMTINNDIASIEKLLETDNIDVALRNINGALLTIVCIDEVRNHLPSIVSLINKDENIYGKCFICDIDKNGILKSLSDKEINTLILSGRSFINKSEVKFTAIMNLCKKVIHNADL